MCRRPFLVTGIASFFTAIIASFLTVSVLRTAGLVLTVLIALAALLRRRRVPQVAFMAAVASLAVLVSMLICSERWMLEQKQYDGKQVSVTARVTEVRHNGGQLTVRTLGGEMGRGKVLYVYPGDLGTAVREEQILKGTVVLRAAFDAADPSDGHSFKASRVLWRAAPIDKTVLIVTDNPKEIPLLARAIGAVRRRIQDTFEAYVSPSSAAVCEAITIGSRNKLDAQTESDFRSCGVVHVLAVSGLHMSVVVGATFFLLRALRCPRRARAVVTMAVVIAFMILCGCGVSIVRSGSMTLVALAATMARRRADGINSMMMAVTGMLAVDPFAVYDVGWQLTFAATAGLLVLLPVWQRETANGIDRLSQPLRCVARPMCAAVGVTLCATLTTLPIAAAWFGEMSLVFLPCNLLLVPLCSALLVVALIGVLTAAVFPFGAAVIFHLADELCRMQVSAAGWVADHPLSSVWCGEWMQIAWIWMFTAAVIGGYMLCRVHGVLRMTALMAALACLLVMTYRLDLCRAAQVRIAKGAHPAFTVQTENGIGAILTGNEEEAAAFDELLYRSGVRSLDWMLWIATPTLVSTTPVEMPPIDWLILTEEAEAYPWLPSAEKVTVVHDGDTVHPMRDVSVVGCEGFYRIRCKESVLLTAVSAADAGRLAQEWLAADTAILPVVLPAHSDRIGAPLTVVCDGAYPPGSVERFVKKLKTVPLFTSQQPTVRIRMGEQAHLRNR